MSQSFPYLFGLSCAWKPRLSSAANHRSFVLKDNVLIFSHSFEILVQIFSVVGLRTDIKGIFRKADGGGGEQP